MTSEEPAFTSLLSQGDDGPVPSGLPLGPDQPSELRQNHEAEDNAQHQPPKPMQNRQLRRIAAIRRRLSHWPNRFKGQPMSQFKISEGFSKDGPCRLYVAVTPVNLRRFGARVEG
jgi:hypothetical protein